MVSPHAPLIFQICILNPFILLIGLYRINHTGAYLFWNLSQFWLELLGTLADIQSNFHILFWKNWDPEVWLTPSHIAGWWWNLIECSFHLSSCQPIISFYPVSFSFFFFFFYAPLGIVKGFYKSGGFSDGLLEKWYLPANLMFFYLPLVLISVYMKNLHGLEKLCSLL